MAFTHVAESVGDLGERVTPLHGRFHGPRLEQVSQEIQVRRVELRDEENGLLTAAHSSHPHLGDVTERPHQPTSLSADDDERRLRIQHTPALGPRLAPRDIEDHVAATAASGEVLAGVVDHVISTERSRLLDVPRAADSGYLRSERLGNLHGECANASRGAVDEDLLSGLKLPVVAQALQGREARHGNGCRLLEGQVRRLPRDRLLHADVLRERSVCNAEGLFTRSDALHVLADRFHRAGEIAADRRRLRPAQPSDRARDPRRTRHVIPIDAIDRSRAHSDEHAVIHELRLLYVPELEDLGGAVLVADDRPHRRRSFWRRLHRSPFVRCKLTM